MGALTLAVLVVLRLDEVDTGASPLFGEHICVVHVQIDGSAADPLRIGPGPARWIVNSSRWANAYPSS